jgi:signal transduction protein with GAF and PtsI domain
MENEVRITMDTFKAVTKAIAQSDNLENMCTYLSELLVAALRIKGCAVWVLDLESKQLELLASFGLSPRYLTKGPLLAKKSLAANLEGKPVIVRDVSKDDNVQYPEQAKEEGIASMLSMPITFLDELIGALRLYHGKTWDVNDQDVDSLQLLAENVGLAMSYTRLCNALNAISEVIQSVGGDRCMSPRWQPTKDADR